MRNRKIDILNHLLSEIEKNIPFKENRNPLVSISDIGWQLSHTLKVINNVCLILAKTDPKKYKKDFNLIRTILFSLCYIPRGKGKAPKTVDSPETITTNDLHIQLNNAKTHISNMQLVDKNAYFIHHVFGILSKKQTLRFLEMHTKHHLKIISDILNK